MLNGPLYPNQPLVNVATEVRFRGDLMVESIRPEFHQNIREKFPQLMVPEAEQGVAPALQPYRFENDQRSHGVQIAVHGFSYYSREYPGHDAFLAVVDSSLVEFVRLIGQLDVNRIGWRYINAIPFARENGLVPLHRFFGQIFGMELTRDHLFTSADMRATLPKDDAQLNIALKTVQSKDVPQEESLLLDIDAFQTYESKGMDASDVMSEICRAHILGYSVFESLITKSYRAYLTGENSGNPAIDYFHPTLTGPDSIVDRFFSAPEDPTGTDIFEFTKPEYPTTGTKYALWQFVVNDVPLSAVVSLHGGQWFAELDWLNLFGEGDSPSDAIGNLSEHIGHFIEFYSGKRTDELTDHAKETRNRFLRVIRNP